MRGHIKFNRLAVQARRRHLAARQAIDKIREQQRRSEAK